MLEMDVLGIPEEGLKETSYDDEKEEEEYGWLFEHLLQHDDHCSKESDGVQV